MARVFDSIGDTSYEEASDSNGGCAHDLLRGRLPLRPLVVAWSGARDVGDDLPNGMSARGGDQRPRPLLRPTGDHGARAGNLRTRAAIDPPPRAGTVAGPLHRRALASPSGCAACRAPAALS